MFLFSSPLINVENLPDAQKKHPPTDKEKNTSNVLYIYVCHGKRFVFLTKFSFKYLPEEKLKNYMMNKNVGLPSPLRKREELFLK